MRSVTETDRQTDRRTDDIIIPKADYTACSMIGYKLMIVHDDKKGPVLFSHMVLRDINYFE